MAARKRFTLARQAEVLRLTSEALDQGALLTREDLARLLCSSVSTVKRDIEALREHQETEREVASTRGTLHDLGRGTTHKRIIVRLHLEGKLPSDMARRTRHAQKNVDRYFSG